MTFSTNMLSGFKTRTPSCRSRVAHALCGHTSRPVPCCHRPSPGRPQGCHGDLSSAHGLQLLQCLLVSWGLCSWTPVVFAWWDIVPWYPLKIHPIFKNQYLINLFNLHWKTYVLILERGEGRKRETERHTPV